MPSRLRVSLFVKIYLLILVTLMLVVILLGALWRFGVERADPVARFPQRLLTLVLPPADASREEHQRAVRRLADAFDAAVIVRAPGRGLIAQEGDPERAGEGRGRRDRIVWRVRLPDGRLVIARLDAPVIPAGARVFGALAVTALVVALLSLPFVWLLTRRIRRLREGVEAFGAGALSTRVPARGGDEIAILAEAFNASAERIERLVEAHRSLLANASHELRSPLARLRLAADLQAGRPTEARREEIVRNLEELDALVGEILLASRLDRPEAPIERDAIDLLDLARREAARHGLEVEGAGEGAPIMGDARLIARLIRNLIENALKHGRPPVGIRVVNAGGLARLEVRDHGEGVPEAMRERLFEPFFRPSGASESAGGWGLGLSLARQIARRHGGDVVCDAAPGGGARFVVTLPADATAAPGGAPPPRPRGG